MHAALSWRAWRAGVGVSGWLPVDATLGGSANQGAKLQLSSGYAKLCWQIGRAAVVPAACSGAEVVLLRGHGFGPHVEPQSAKAIFGAVQAGGLLRLRSAARLSLVLEADVVVPIGDRKVVLAGDAPAEIYEPSWGLRLACGAEWEF